jgi:hypothetical protein
MARERGTVSLGTGCGLKHGLPRWFAILCESTHQQSKNERRKKEEKGLPQAAIQDLFLLWIGKD